MQVLQFFSNPINFLFLFLYTTIVFIGVATIITLIKKKEL